MVSSQDLTNDWENHFENTVKASNREVALYLLQYGDTFILFKGKCLRVVYIYALCEEITAWFSLKFILSHVIFVLSYAEGNGTYFLRKKVININHQNVTINVNIKE